ncbi:VRR-NUC domain-containing protein [Caproiciproducens sp.]|uniref:VRR-NUC domain-containing protein n=1 Tax=Caproiciproducens sp. TaxID=1954376 RepID=UPI0028A1C27A|nr:VRR-NUC domain-containing protein [Caproiciproducens sp.]
MTEADIQNSIRLALSPHAMVFRTNSGDFWQGERVYSKEFHEDVLIHLRKVQGLPKGFSDLTYFGFDGQAGFIEVKKPRGAIRPEQTNFINLMQSYGYRAGIAQSAEDALKIIGRK